MKPDGPSMQLRMVTESIRYSENGTETNTGCREIESYLSSSALIKFVIRRVSEEFMGYKLTY